MSLVREFIRSVLLESVGLCSSPKVIFMAGGPGSGKSTVIRALGLQNELSIVNPDDMYEESLKAAGIPLQRGDLVNDYKLIKRKYKQAEEEGDSALVAELEPEYLALRAVMSQNMKLFAAARKAAKLQAQEYACDKQSFLVDGTGGDRRAIAKQVRDLRDQGYDVGMIYIDVPLETSMARNRARGEAGGRGLHDDTVTKSWTAVSKNRELYSELFGDSFFYVDASEGNFQDGISEIRGPVETFLNRV